MSGIPSRCVVDTNVATTANGANAGAPQICVVNSAKALQEVIVHGHVFVDWQQALAVIGVSIHFVCSAEIRAKYEEKMGS